MHQMYSPSSYDSVVGGQGGARCSGTAHTSCSSGPSDAKKIDGMCHCGRRERASCARRCEQRAHGRETGSSRSGEYLSLKDVAELINLV
jgi:hypothetical protein